MTLRVMDSGLRSARENLSITEALCRRRRDGFGVDTLRFQHFPRSAIVGRHQLLGRELHLDWVAAQGVETARRMTGGGAIVMGPGLLGWELVLARRAVPGSLDAVAARLCEGVAAGLRRLGVPAAYRPRNDIEVEGRKVSGTGGYFDGDVLVFQGTVLIDLDLAFMANALVLPTEKLGRRGMAALAERVGDLHGCLGFVPPVAAVQNALAGALAAALGAERLAGGLCAEELALARHIHDAEIGTDAFVTGADDVPPAAGRVLTRIARTEGGSVHVTLKLRDGADGLIDQAVIAGDFFAAPPGAIAALEAALRAVPVARAAAVARVVLQAADVRFLRMERGAVVDAIAAACGTAA